MGSEMCIRDRAGRDDTEREAEVDAQGRQPESPAPEPVLDYPTAVDLAHGEHVQRLGHEAAPVNEDVGGGWSAMDRVVFWIIWSFGHSYDAGWKSVFRVMEVTHTGSRQKPRRGEDFSARRALGNSEQPSG